jgi:hypothetical protein
MGGNIVGIVLFLLFVGQIILTDVRLLVNAYAKAKGDPDRVDKVFRPYVYTKTSIMVFDMLLLIVELYVVHDMAVTGRQRREDQ